LAISFALVSTADSRTSQCGVEAPFHAAFFAGPGGAWKRDLLGGAGGVDVQALQPRFVRASQWVQVVNWACARRVATIYPANSDQAQRARIRSDRNTKP